MVLVKKCILMCLFTNKVDPNILIPNKTKKNESNIIIFNNRINREKSISTNTELSSPTFKTSSSSTKSQEDVIDEYNEMYDTKIKICYFDNNNLEYDYITKYNMTK
tara:strand:- start:261 stop:578 length:318 start_codon:yes stop_codon:yes gene_type:complete